MLRWASFLTLSVIVGVLVFVWVEPGPLLIDEVTYHRMTHDLVAGHGFTLWNGNEELRSPELATRHVLADHTGTLAAQYPYGAPLLAVPFYLGFGPRGLFVINALAYLFAIALCYRLASKLSCDRPTAAIGAALLVTSFFTEYAFAIWPHTTSVLAILGSVALTLGAVQAVSRRRAMTLAGLAGLVVGVGATLRLDVLFVVPAIGMPFLFASPTKVRELVAMIVGLVPGLGVNLVTNYARWESLSPLSYGPQNSAQLGRYLVFVAACGIGAAAAWAISRPGRLAWLRARSKVLVLVALGALIVSLAIPRMHDVWRGIAAVTIDLRLRPDDSNVEWYGEHKKALLQSCPFFVLAVVPMWRAIRGPEVSSVPSWMVVVAAIPIAFYGAFSWHGGLAVNMRYLLAAVPILCILSAIAVRDVAQLAVKWPAVCAVVATAVVALMSGASTDLRLTVSLAIALILAGVLYAWQRRPERLTASVALVLAGVAVGWSAAETTRDAIWSRGARQWNYRVAETIAPHLPERALLFADLPDPFFGLIEHVPGIRIAVFVDDIDDAHRLIRTELGRGRRVFGALRSQTWATLERIGALNSVSVQPIGRVGLYLFAEIRGR